MKTSITFSLDLELATKIAKLGKDKNDIAGKLFREYFTKRELPNWNVCPTCGTGYSSKIGHCPTCKLKEAKIEVDINKTQLEEISKTEQIKKLEEEKGNNSKSLEELNQLEKKLKNDLENQREQLARRKNTSYGTEGLSNEEILKRIANKEKDIQDTLTKLDEVKEARWKLSDVAQSIEKIKK
jgi:hypothetical protein